MKTPSDLGLCDTGQSASTGAAPSAEIVIAEDEAGAVASAVELSAECSDDTAGAAVPTAQLANRAHMHMTKTKRGSFFAGMAFTSYSIITSQVDYKTS